MSYARLPLWCRDYIVGVETINQAIDNLNAIRDLLATQHGMGDLNPNRSALPGTTTGEGGHDDPVFARAVGIHIFRREDDNKSSLAFGSSDVVAGWERTARGVYILHLRNLPGEYLSWAEATPVPALGLGGPPMCRFVQCDVRATMFGSSARKNATMGQHVCCQAYVTLEGDSWLHDYEFNVLLFFAKAAEE